MPAAWTTDDQTAFLEARLDEYKVINAGSQEYAPFWTAVTHAWFQQWPAIEDIFPGRQKEDLSQPELDQLQTLVKTRKKVHFFSK